MLFFWAVMRLCAFPTHLSSHQLCVAYKEETIISADASIIASAAPCLCRSIDHRHRRIAHRIYGALIIWCSALIFLYSALIFWCSYYKTLPTAPFLFGVAITDASIIASTALCQFDVDTIIMHSRSPIWIAIIIMHSGSPSSIGCCYYNHAQLIAYLE